MKVKVTWDPAPTVKLLVSNSKASPSALISKLASGAAGVVAVGTAVASSAGVVAVGTAVAVAGTCVGVLVARGRGEAVAPSPPQARARKQKGSQKSNHQEGCSLHNSPIT